MGPRAKRPVKVNTNWGGVEESNAVGMHEFFDLAEMLGADADVNGKLGSGSVQEMADWVEYLTSDSKSTLANMRRVGRLVRRREGHQCRLPVPAKHAA